MGGGEVIEREKERVGQLKKVTFVDTLGEAHVCTHLSVTQPSDALFLMVERCFEYFEQFAAKYSFEKLSNQCCSKLLLQVNTCLHMLLCSGSAFWLTPEQPKHSIAGHR